MQYGGCNNDVTICVDGTRSAFRRSMKIHTIIYSEAHLAWASTKFIKPFPDSALMVRAQSE